MITGLLFFIAVLPLGAQIKHDCLTSGPVNKLFGEQIYSMNERYLMTDASGHYFFRKVDGLPMLYKANNKGMELIRGELLSLKVNGKAQTFIDMIAFGQEIYIITAAADLSKHQYTVYRQRIDKTTLKIIPAIAAVGTAAFNMPESSKQDIPDWVEIRIAPNGSRMVVMCSDMVPPEILEFTNWFVVYDSLFAKRNEYEVPAALSEKGWQVIWPQLFDNGDMLVTDYSVSFDDKNNRIYGDTKVSLFRGYGKPFQVFINLGEADLPDDLHYTVNGNIVQVTGSFTNKYNDDRRGLFNMIWDIEERTTRIESKKTMEALGFQVSRPTSEGRLHLLINDIVRYPDGSFLVISEEQMRITYLGLYRNMIQSVAVHGYYINIYLVRYGADGFVLWKSTVPKTVKLENYNNRFGTMIAVRQQKNVVIYFNDTNAGKAKAIEVTPDGKVAEILDDSEVLENVYVMGHLSNTKDVEHGFIYVRRKNRAAYQLLSCNSGG